MSEKKARASVFFVIAIIAFICSCILFSMTGGVSDWFEDIGMNDTDNTTDDLGLSNFLENDSYSDYDSSSDSSNKDSSSKFLDDLTKKDKSSSHNSSSSDSGKITPEKQDSGDDSGKVTPKSSSGN